MKIKKIYYSKNKIIKLQTLKLYSKKNKNSTKKHFSQVHTHLNKISNIIYKYHTTNKKILFLGFPATFKSSLKNTKHKIIPEFILFNGIINNRMSLNKITKIKNYSLFAIKLLLKIKKIDLIIAYNQNKNSTIIQESYIARIPTITFSEYLTITNNNTNYESLGNYELLNEKDESNSFLITFIKTILTKAKRSMKNKKKKFNI